MNIWVLNIYLKVNYSVATLYLGYIRPIIVVDVNIGVKDLPKGYLYSDNLDLIKVAEVLSHRTIEVLENIF